MIDLKRYTLAIVLALLAASCSAEMSDARATAGGSATRPVNTDIPRLLRELERGEAADRRAAAADLGANGAQARRASAALESVARGDESDLVRVTAARALWQVTGEADLAVSMLRGELARALGTYRTLDAADSAAADDAHFDALFDALNHIDSVATALGDIGNGARDAAPELMILLAERIGMGYQDLVPTVASALGRIGPAAASVLPELEALRDTTVGRQNRDAIDLAVARISGEAVPEPVSPPFPETNPDNG